jgi:hypothetical protein
MRKYLIAAAALLASAVVANAGSAEIPSAFRGSWCYVGPGPDKKYDIYHRKPANKDCDGTGDADFDVTATRWDGVEHSCELFQVHSSNSVFTGSFHCDGDNRQTKQITLQIRGRELLYNIDSGAHAKWLPSLKTFEGSYNNKDGDQIFEITAENKLIAFRWGSECKIKAIKIFPSAETIIADADVTLSCTNWKWRWRGTRPIPAQRIEHQTWTLTAGEDTMSLTIVAGKDTISGLGEGANTFNRSGSDPD